MEPLILEKGELLLKKMSQTDEGVDELFKKVEDEPDLESYTIEVGVPRWLWLPVLPTSPGTPGLTHFPCADPDGAVGEGGREIHAAEAGD